jgi:CheY-like chemotaxis protein
VAEAKNLGPKAVEAALGYAMADGHPASATAAAQVLGQIGNAEELLYGGPKPGALALALQNPDRRLRIAAARAIVAIKPKRQFAGSSYMLQTLGYFASSSGMRRALLAGANVEDLRRMVPALTVAGFQTDTATNGREAMRMAVSSPDYELAMIDAGIDQPPLNLLLQQLRHDDRSDDLRVGLIAREGFSERAQHVAENDPLTKAFARPHDDASVAWQLEQLATLRPEEFVTFKERQRQAVEALDMLGELGRNPGKLYDMHQVEKAVLAAMNTPSLSGKAIAVLAEINSPEAQRALVETAGRVTRPLEIRQAAVSAFRQNLQAHGILLTKEEIIKQYQQYNESKNQDESTQKILALILDCLETPTKAGK